MKHPHRLGQSDLRVPRLGVGAMMWGEARDWRGSTPPRRHTGAPTDLKPRQRLSRSV